jgi:prevent-host-death family protein
MGSEARTSHMCYSRAMDTGEVSVRELRNHVSEVLRRVEAGERLRVTVDRRPVAELIPLPHRRLAVPWSQVQAALATAQADSGLSDELREALPGTTDER